MMLILIVRHSHNKQSTVSTFKRFINQLPPNQIKSLLLSHHHSTSALVSEILTSRQCKKNNNLHMDSTYLQTVQKTMCKIHIYSVHTVYYKDILSYQLHIIHRLYTSALCTHLYIVICEEETLMCLLQHCICVSRPCEILGDVNAEELKAVNRWWWVCVLCSVSCNPPPAPWSCRCWVRGGSPDTI